MTAVTARQCPSKSTRPVSLLRTALYLPGAHGVSQDGPVVEGIFSPFGQPERIQRRSSGCETAPWSTCRGQSGAGGVSLGFGAAGSGGQSRLFMVPSGMVVWQNLAFLQLSS